MKQDNKRYFILYLQLASCAALPDERRENSTERFFLQECKAGAAAVIFFLRFLFSPTSSCLIRVALLCRGMPDIQWMNLDPVKLMEELSQFTSLEGFKEMLDKAQVGHANAH